MSRIVLIVAIVFLSTFTSGCTKLFNDDALLPDWTNVKKTPFPLEQKNISNPVLTLNDITDRDAYFIADCSLFYDNHTWYMLFEVLNHTGGADIGLAKSENGFEWKYDRVILDEPFSTAYPELFKWKKNYYMIVETNTENQVRLYRAKEFPYKWEFLTVLIQGKRFVDPSIFRYNNKWWMFAPTAGKDIGNTYLYYSDSLLDPSKWKEHPNSPIVKNDSSKSRGGGRVIVFNNNQIIRLAQKCDIGYGEAVRAFKVDVLTEEKYAEHEIEESPVAKASGEGWNAEGMHCLGVWWNGTEWIACVDGRYKNRWSIGMLKSVDCNK